MTALRLPLPDADSLAHDRVRWSTLIYNRESGAARARWSVNVTKALSQVSKSLAVSPSCACQLYLKVLGLCLFFDNHNCCSTPEANHNYLDFSQTNVKFPDFSRFTMCVATMQRIDHCSSFNEHLSRVSVQWWQNHTSLVSQSQCSVCFRTNRKCRWCIFLSSVSVVMVTMSRLSPKNS